MKTALIVTIHNRVHIRLKFQQQWQAEFACLDMVNNLGEYASSQYFAYPYSRYINII